MSMWTEPQWEDVIVSGSSEERLRAVGICTMIALVYVALLYAPALLLSSPRSVREHMLRRFVCAAVGSTLAPIVCFKFLPVRPRWETNFTAFFELFGLHGHHLCQAVGYPLLLTGMFYLGPLLMGIFNLSNWLLENSQQGGLLTNQVWSGLEAQAKNLVSDVLVWRNCVVAPVSEELVFRACMVPLLLCGGFSTSATIFFCPLFFALAHVHHFWDLMYRQKHELSTAALIVGMQLGYTTVFGWYATFLYLRTGHLLAPIVAHIFCNTMGLPGIREAMGSSHRKVIGLAYLTGLVGYITLLRQLSDPRLYNDGSGTEGCYCWSGFCKWPERQKAG